MREHVFLHAAQACLCHVGRLRLICKLLGRDVTIRLVFALVLSRLDYCNGVLAGLPPSTLAPPQQVLHATAHLINKLKPNDYVTAPLKIFTGCQSSSASSLSCVYSCTKQVSARLQNTCRTCSLPVPLLPDYVHHLPVELGCAIINF